MPEAASNAQSLTGARKAAMLLISIGNQAASEILRHMAPSDVQRIASEIANVEYVTQEASAQILDEFDKLVSAREVLAPGGKDYVQKLLETTFGEAEAKRLFEQAIYAKPVKSVDLTDLRQSDPKQLVKLIQDEQPQTVALILAHMGTKIGSALLSLLPEESRGPVVEKLARMGQLSGDTVQRVLGVVQKKFQAVGKSHDRLSYGGVTAVANMLNNLDPTASKAVLEALEQSDPNLAVEIRNVLFTFEDLLTVPESTIRECLGGIDKKTLSVALKGASEDLRGHIMKCMSSRAAEMLREDMDALGPVRMRDVAKAQGEVINTLRAMEAEGKISLRNEEQDAFVV